MIAYLKIILLSFVPVTELRGALPLAIVYYHLNFWLSLVAAVVGSFLGGAFVIFFLAYIEKIIDKVLFLKKAKEKVFLHTRKKQAKLFETLKEGVVFVLAAIPIPVLGGSYTAALAAYLFGANKTKALGYILAGLFVQGFIIAMLSKLI